MTGSLQIRNGIYQCVLNFKDEKGKRKQKWISTKLEEKGNKKKAMKILNELLAKHCDEGFQSSKNLKFVEYLEKWLESKRGSIENNTFLEYQKLINNHITPYFKPMKLSIRDIKPKHIADFYEFKSKSGRADGKPGGVSPRVLKYLSTVFCQVFKKANIEQILETHPSINVPIPKTARKERVGKFLESTEVQNLINAFEGHILKPIVIIAIYYGLRRSEVLGLMWDAIHFEKNTIEIKHTVLWERYRKERPHEDVFES